MQNIYRPIYKPMYTCLNTDQNVADATKCEWYKHLKECQKETIQVNHNDKQVKTKNKNTHHICQQIATYRYRCSLAWVETARCMTRGCAGRGPDGGGGGG